MKLYQYDCPGCIKIVRFPDDIASGNWHRREVVADFVHSDAGRAAYAAFRTGLARTPGASLWTLDGKCQVGTIEQITSGA